MNKLGLSLDGVSAGARRISGRILAGLVLTSPLASAHFVLQTPASWMSQDSSGNPQKLGPCGNEGGGTPTGTVTTFAPGETVTVTIKEAVFHPGHYRIALGVESRDSLPAEPVVTAGSTPCGSVPIESPATFPVLADGVFQHTTAFSGPQTVQVTLPTNVTCAKCTLQVIEFMSDHPLNNPGGCFYHHCADIAIQTTGVGGAMSTGGAPSTGGTQQRGSGGMMMMSTGGRNMTGSGSSLVSTGGVIATGGRSATGIGGLSSSGGMSNATGGRLAIGTGGLNASGGVSTITDGGSTVGDGGSVASGGSSSLATGGFADLAGSGGTTQSDRTASPNGGTSQAISAISSAGTQVISRANSTDSRAAGCACSVPGATSKSPLLQFTLCLVLGLLVSLRRRVARFSRGLPPTS